MSLVMTVTLGWASRRSGGPQNFARNKKNEQTLHTFRCSRWVRSVSITMLNNCDPHWIFLAPTLWRGQSLMHCYVCTQYVYTFQDTAGITPNIPKVSNIASSAWVSAFFLRVARSGHRAFFSSYHGIPMQGINIVYGFHCAGRWFDGKLPDYFVIFIKPEQVWSHCEQSIQL
jgi:hypothetical protein